MSPSKKQCPLLSRILMKPVFEPFRVNQCGLCPISNRFFQSFHTPKKRYYTCYHEWFIGVCKWKIYKISTIIDSIFWNLKTKRAVVYLTKIVALVINATVALVKVKDTPICPTSIGDNRENETPDIDTVPPYGPIQDYITMLACLGPFQCHTCPALLLKNPKVTLQCIRTNTQVRCAFKRPVTFWQHYVN